MGTGTRLGFLALLSAAGALFGGTVEIMALPQGFKEEIVFQNLVDPTTLRFSPDGRIFVAEKSGRILVFDTLEDTAPTVLADLSPQVHNFWDRGLLGIALHPDFPNTPWLYVLYTHDFDPLDPAHPAPRYGDTCPDTDPNGAVIGPGATADGCVVNGRLSRLTVAANNTLVGGELVMLQHRWCQQFPTHSIGTVTFGPEGALYVSAGDGANFDFEDWGQYGGTRTSISLPTPANPCADPYAPRGTAVPKPDTEGGALRSQGARTPDNVSLDGTIIRLDPDTGAAWPANPLIGGATTEDDLIIAYGLRNPFRMVLRPGTSEVWLGDVGWYDWEEINKIDDPDDSIVENFGWPCLEGPDRPPGYNAPAPDNIALCDTLLDQDATAPWFHFEHYQPVYPGDPCDTTSGSSVTGLAFYQGGNYPATYAGALFFADYSRSCVFVMTTPPGGDPAQASRTVFLSSAANSQQVGNPRPTDIQIGPGGDLFVVDHVGGTIRRITYNATNSPPTAAIEASPTNGPLPLTVNFDGSGSTDPDPGTTLFYAWDLDGDGLFDDGTLAQGSRVYDTAGDVVVSLRVTDDNGATSTTSITISPGNSTPIATLTAPSGSLHWRVGQPISFAGEGQDADQGALGASAMDWEVILHHCVGGPGTCHDHSIATFQDVASGFFTAPDHQYYTELEFVLTVTDAGGLTDIASVVLAPDAVINNYQSNPAGATLSISGFQGTADFAHGSIIGSNNSLIAITPQVIGGTNHYFVSWDDGGGPVRSFAQGASPLTFRANYAVCVPNEATCNGVDEDCDGVTDDGFPDGDSDGQKDCTDCAPSDGTAFGAPVEVQGVSVARTVPTRISWSQQNLGTGTQYVVASGTIAATANIPFGSGVCAGAVSTGLLDDTRPNPPPGSIYYYMVKSRNACGGGTFGTTARDAHPGCP